ncbi:MAG: glycosyltransferase, partial [Bacteroidia bacterium]|nr:glycosyltransferase [Bacteroidia bacterium]
KKYNKRDNEIVVIPHGAFSHYDINVKGESNPPIAKYNFLFFGRVTEYKGIDILLEAYAMLSKERDDVSLRIIGEGDFSPYRHLLANCKNCVVDNRYVGDDEVHSFFSMNNTITVIPYTSATQSGVIPIAMREQSLIINTRISGLLEQTQNGALSLCCDVSAEALYEQMLYAIDHYSDCKTKVCDAKRYIDSLSWDKLANDLSAHFCRMLN